MRPLRQHLTYANTMATVAFLLATSGSAYAAAKVNSHQIVDNTVKSADLKDGAAVKGIDVKDDSLTGADIDEATLVDVPLPELPGVPGLEQVGSSPEDVGAALVKTVTAECPAGKVALSGGTWTSSPAVHALSGALSDAQTYSATFLNTGLVTGQAGVNVVCVKVKS